MTDTTKKILIAGGYGVVGSAMARHLRALMPGTELILAGRNPQNGDSLASELGAAHTLKLDTAAPEDALASVGPLDIIVCALPDPQDRLLRYALNHGIAHVSITRSTRDMAALAGLIAHHGVTAPVVPLAHWQAGLLTLAALDAVADMDRVDRLTLSALFDMADPIGPMTVADAEGFMGEALQRRDGTWHWVDAEQEKTKRRLDSKAVDVAPVSVLDVTGLAAATGAADIRFDLAIDTSRGTAAGNAASHDMWIEADGTRGGKPVSRARMVSDPKGQAHLTGLGAALIVQRILEAHADLAPRLYAPETLLPPADAMAALADHGIEISDDR